MPLIICFIFYLIYLVWEKRKNDRCLIAFSHVIHVGGTRGKTGVCRLLDGMLRERYRVLTKTTGTDPRIIGPDGRDRPLGRRGPANIREQLRVIRGAARAGAEVLILECMAVDPDLTRFTQDKMVKSRISVLTNVRPDHILELGRDPVAITRALAGVIPENGVLYTAETAQLELIRALAEERGSRVVHCPGAGPDGENLAIASAVARDLGLSEEEISRGLEAVQADFGTARLYPLETAGGERADFLSLFSANDPVSARALLESVGGDRREIRYLYNHRWDRPDRALLFAETFFQELDGGTVYILGDNRPLARRLIGKNPSLDVRPLAAWRNCLDVPGGTLLVGLGNIRGEARRMVEALERGEHRWES